MKYLNNFENYNESFKSLIASSALILSLFTNQATGQETRKELKTKAMLSQFDTFDVKKLTDSLIKKNFQLIQNQRSIESKFLVSSGAGITAKDAIDRAMEDANDKIEFLGRKGAQNIWLYEETVGSKGSEVFHPNSGPRTGNFHAVIITEILNKKVKKGGSLYDPQLNIYR